MCARPGYKLTEVGEIPEDWEVVSLGAIATFRTGPFGSALHKTDYVNGGIPVINPMQIVEGKVCPTLSMTVSNDTLQKLSEFVLEKDDIILGRRGEMGRCAVVDDISTGWLCGTGSLIIRSQEVNTYFLFRILSSARVANDLETSSIGTTMANLNHDVLSNLQIQRPTTIKEQTAIAAALSDVDALIDALEQSIAKKRNIKQGAMQELLTGKRRLPGFMGEWEEKRLGDIVHIDPETINQNEFKNIVINYISLENINRGVLDGYSEISFIYAPSRARRKIYKNDILISTVRPNLMSHLLFNKSENNWVCSTGFCVIRCTENISCTAFIYHHFFASIVNKQINTLIAGSNYPAINSLDVSNLYILLPAFEEQTAIAAVLTDMDNAIAALEAKLTKARQIKAGMMQELLTGRIRLI